MTDRCRVSSSATKGVLAQYLEDVLARLMYSRLSSFLSFEALKLVLESVLSCSWKSAACGSSPLDLGVGKCGRGLGLGVAISEFNNIMRIRWESYIVKIIAGFKFKLEHDRRIEHHQEDCLHPQRQARPHVELHRARRPLRHPQVPPALPRSMIAKLPGEQKFMGPHLELVCLLQAAEI
jgi:hypothetical protein